MSAWEKYNDMLHQIFPMTNPQSLIHPLVRELHPCVYGDQPKIKGLIKLNTNENPHPPSPKMLAVVKTAVDGRLRLHYFSDRIGGGGGGDFGGGAYDSATRKAMRSQSYNTRNSK